MANSPEVTFEKHLKNLRRVLADIAKHSGLSGKALTELAEKIRLNSVHTGHAVKNLQNMAGADKKVAAEAIKTALAIDNKTKALERNQSEQLDLIKHQNNWIAQQKQVKQAQEIDIHNWKEQTRLSKLHSQAIIENNKRDRQSLDAKKKVVEANRKHTEKLRILIDRMKEAGLDTRQFVIENKKLIKTSRNSTLAMDRLNRAAKNYNIGLKKSWLGVRNFRNSNGDLGLSFSTLRSKMLLASFGFATFLAPLVRGMKLSLDAASSFEALRTRLDALYGSTIKGQQAFNTFNETAATTPFQLQNVVNAGAQLKAFGVDAENMIKPIADLAAFMGVDVVDAANAMGRAFAGGAGAADILRERGILNLIKTSQGLDDLSKTTLPEFRKALIDTLQDPLVGIQGSTTKLAETFSGSFSNMQDSVTRLAAEIGNELLPKAKSVTKSVKSFADSIRELIISTRDFNFDETLTSDNIEHVLSLINQYEEVLPNVSKETGFAGKTFELYAKILGGFSPKLDTVIAAYNRFNSVNVDGIEGLETSEEKAALLSKRLEALRKVYKTLGDAQFQIVQNFDNESISFLGLEEAYARTKAGQEKLILTQIKSFTQMRDSLPVMASLSEEYEQLTEVIDFLTEKFNNLNKEVEKPVEKSGIQKLTEDWQHQKDVIDITVAAYENARSGINGLTSEEEKKLQVDIELLNIAKSQGISLETLMEKYPELVKLIISTTEAQFNHNEQLDLNKQKLDFIKDSLGEELSLREQLIGSLTAEQEKRIELANIEKERASIILDQLSGVTSAWQANLDARLKSEIKTLKESEKYRNADS